MKNVSNEFSSKMKVALSQQDEHRGKIENELQGIREHAGLGYSFLKKIKIVIISLVLLTVASGVYVYIEHPQLTNAYGVSVLSVGLVVSVIYLRRMIDKRME
ncbi:MAG: hypothetical protein LWY06_00150 [Firmicutes bacterium]|nr:hypothetical protein [Bacillota bacterium]